MRRLALPCLATLLLAACVDPDPADDAAPAPARDAADDPGRPLVDDLARPAFASVAVDARGFRVDGRYQLLRGGSVQWFRLPPAVWEDRLRRFRAAGYNTVDVYVPWNLIEPREGQFQLDQPDLRGFLRLCQQLGLYVYLRPGPYITNELDGGGVPAWVLERTTKKHKDADGRPNLRTNDPDYLALVARYLRALDEVVRPYLITRGGPIVLYAIENEYDWFELFHEVDKLFWYDGGPERNLLERPDTTGYFTALRDLVRSHGIDVPITTCPGSAKVAGTGDVPGVVPMPNVYVAGKTERVAYDIVADMHDPARHGGAYLDLPTGSTETERTAARMNRLILGGMDATFAFNAVGMATGGYQNAIVLNNAGPSSIFELSTDRVLDAFVAPTVGYFHNVVDYDGAIGPSGTLRAKFWDLRRANLALDTLEPIVAPAERPRRSGRGLGGGDPRLVVDAPGLGALEDGVRVHYWFDGGAAGAVIGLTNETGAPVTVAPGAIRLDGVALPRFTTMTVPAGATPVPTTGAPVEAEHAQLLPVGLPLSAEARLAYTTSALLTVRPGPRGRLVMVHGEAGSAGELVLDRLTGAATIEARPDGVQVAAQDAAHLALTYRHDGDQLVVVRTAGGERLTLWITTRERAGRTWFFRDGDAPVVLVGPDLAWAGPDGRLVTEQRHDGEVALLSAAPLALDGHAPVAPFDPATGRTVLRPRAPVDVAGAAAIRAELGRGLALDDAAEAAPTLAGDAATGWVSWTGAPRPLEQLGLRGGHVWYRAELSITDPGRRAWPLYVEHASDFVGVYVNGRYVTTLAPLGTELDSDSLSAAYRFPDLRPYLVAGRNVIAFRVEVWGHGSFMWPRGWLIGSRAQLPSLGFDAWKGLWGAADLGGVALTRWSVRPGLGGERRDLPGQPESAPWRAAGIPLGLGKGAVTWYRVRLDPATLPDPALVEAPVVLRLGGRAAKATIYLDGQVIGRWLSDEQWLARGTWARPIRTMWMNTSPDDFPVARAALRAGGSELLLAVEDTSGPDEVAGRLERLTVELAREERGLVAGAVERVPTPAARRVIAARAAD